MRAFHFVLFYFFSASALELQLNVGRARDWDVGDVVCVRHDLEHIRSLFNLVVGLVNGLLSYFQHFSMSAKEDFVIAIILTLTL